MADKLKYKTRPDKLKHIYAGIDKRLTERDEGENTFYRYSPTLNKIKFTFCQNHQQIAPHDAEIVCSV